MLLMMNFVCDCSVMAGPAPQLRVRWSAQAALARVQCAIWRAGGQARRFVFGWGKQFPTCQCVPLLLAAQPAELHRPASSPFSSTKTDSTRRLLTRINLCPVLPQWAAGDIIGCCIDLDAGSMRFYRNGKDLVSWLRNRALSATAEPCGSFPTRLTECNESQQVDCSPLPKLSHQLPCGTCCPPQPQGVAFTNVRRGMPGMAYFAGVSLSYSGGCMGSSACVITAACHASAALQEGSTLPRRHAPVCCLLPTALPSHPCRPAERCELNFGARPFQHPVEGYQPLHLELPSPEDTAETGLPGGRAGQLAAARYLAGCFSRLTDVSSPSPAAPAAPAAAEPAAVEPAEAAAAVAAAASQPASEGSSHEDGSGGEEFEEQPLSGGPLFPTATAGMGARPPLGAGLLPDGHMLAALAAAGSSKPPARPGSAQDRPSSAGAPAIGMDDRVLLGAVLAQHLGPLCCDQNIVEAALLPWLDDTAGDLCSNPGPAVPSRLSFEEHGASGQQGGSGIGGSGGGGADAEPAAPDAPASSPAAATASAAAPKQAAEGLELGRQRLAQLLQLLAAVLEPEELSVLVSTVCWVRCNALPGVLRSLLCLELP